MTRLNVLSEVRSNVTTDTSEKGLESLICAALTSFAHSPVKGGSRVETISKVLIPSKGPGDYCRGLCAVSWYVQLVETTRLHQGVQESVRQLFIGLPFLNATEDIH